MKLLAAYDRMLDHLRRIELAAGVLFFTAIVLINSANMLSRWFAGHAFDWVLEISLIFFVYAVLFIVPVLYRDKDLIQMHLIEELLSPRGVTILAIVVEFAVIAFFVYLLPHALHLSLSQIDMLSRGLGIPRIWVTLPVPLAAGLTLPVCLSNLAHQVPALLRSAGNAPPTGD